MISCRAEDFQRKLTGTRVPGAQILGNYEVLLVPVTGISRTGNTREYPGNCQKGNNDHAIFVLKRISWKISHERLSRGRDVGDDRLPCPGFAT